MRTLNADTVRTMNANARKGRQSKSDFPILNAIFPTHFTVYVQDARWLFGCSTKEAYSQACNHKRSTCDRESTMHSRDRRDRHRDSSEGRRRHFRKMEINEMRGRKKKKKRQKGTLASWH